jgi:hypothetical protein
MSRLMATASRSAAASRHWEALANSRRVWTDVPANSDYPVGIGTGYKGLAYRLAFGQLDGFLGWELLVFLDEAGRLVEIHVVECLIQG